MKSWRNAVRSGHRGTLLSAVLYFDVSFMVWVMAGGLGIYIAGDLGLSAAQKGLLVATPAFGGALFRILLGFLADRYGPKTVGTVSMTTVLIPLVWGRLGATSLHAMLGVGLLLGIAGGSFAVAMPLASRSYPKEHQGMAMGIAGAGNSGTIVEALLAPRLAQHFGWHAVFGLAIIPVALVLLCFVIVAREAPPMPHSGANGSTWRLFRQSELWRLSLFYGITFGGFVGLAGFLPIYLHDQFGTAPVLAGTLAAVCVFAGSFFRPIGGYLSDRIGGTTLLFCLFPVAGAALTGANFSSSLRLSVVFLFAGMMSLGAGNGAVFQLAPERFAKEIGTVSGIVGAAGSIGGSLLPLIVGYAKQFTGSYHAGISIFILAIAAAMGPLVIQHRYRNQQKRATRLGALPEPSRQQSEVDARPPAIGWDGVRIRMELAFRGNPAA